MVIAFRRFGGFFEGGGGGGEGGFEHGYGAYGGVEVRPEGCQFLRSRGWEAIEVGSTLGGSRAGGKGVARE